MLRFVIPYSFNKKLFEAYDYEMSLTTNPNDWICFVDGDTAFLSADFGHQIQQYINRYPDTGLFTCYASRCHYAVQVRKGTEMENPDMLYHKKQADNIRRELDGKVKEVERRVAGHLLVIQKKTWMMIRNQVKEKTAGKNILGVDTKISNAILKAGLKIRLMRGLYIFHYLRMAEGFGYKKHLE